VGASLLIFLRQKLCGQQPNVDKLLLEKPGEPPINPTGSRRTSMQSVSSLDFLACVTQPSRLPFRYPCPTRLRSVRADAVRFRDTGKCWRNWSVRLSGAHRQRHGLWL
jgi:hypothetical protein